jgi:hypothetical protein
MRKKELIERIENLEKALQKEVGLREQTDKTANEIKEVLDFIVEHGKDGVVVGTKWKCIAFFYTIAYIDNKKIKCCETSFCGRMSSLYKSKIEIVKTDKHSIIFSFANEYYKVDKATAIYMQIPEPLFVSKEKEKETKAKKKGAKNET